MSDPVVLRRSLREPIDAKLDSLKRALEAAYAGSAENGSFFRRGGGEYVPSVFITFNQLRADVYALLADPVGGASPPRPKVICLCGSTRFVELFATLTWVLERNEGAIVLGCTLLPMWFCGVTSHFGEITGTKEQCDEHHKRKIDLSDEVLVINVNGYIGESTRSEIDYATKLGKPLRYLESEPELMLAAVQRRDLEAVGGASPAPGWHPKNEEETTRPSGAEKTEDGAASRPLSRIEKEPNLLATMDGLTWATEFCRITGFKDEAWALAWFCNAIMTGFDEANRRRDVEIRQFVGWLSADIPELHAVDVPRLAESLERFNRRCDELAAGDSEAARAGMNDVTSGGSRHNFLTVEGATTMSLPPDRIT